MNFIDEPLFFTSKESSFELKIVRYIKGRFLASRRFLASGSKELFLASRQTVP